MKKLVIIMTVLFFAGSLLAKDLLDNKQLNKAPAVKYKAQVQKDKEAQYRVVMKMLDSMSFVLETNTLRDPRGNIAQVSPMLNFIMVDSAQAVIQVGSSSQLGANGVGGVTAKGEITKWKLIKNEKRRTFTLTMSVFTPIGIYDVTMFISADGNTSATLSGLNPGRLFFDGRLIPLAMSRVYEGRSL